MSGLRTFVYRGCQHGIRKPGKESVVDVSVSWWNQRVRVSSCRLMDTGSGELGVTTS